jgi:phage-related protein (TIGR01555 family)
MTDNPTFTGDENIIVLDKLVNLVAGLGTANDRSIASYYMPPVWTPEQIANSYRSSWLAKKIVNIPAMEAVRKWRDWQAEKDQITALEQEERRLSVPAKIHQALTMARLWGGAGIYIGTGEQDVTKPLEPSRIAKGGIRFLNVLTPRSLTPGEIDRNPESPWFGKPVHFQVQGPDKMINAHPSRFVILSTSQANDEEMLSGSSILSSTGGFWGDSVLISTLDSIRDVDSTSANIVNLVFQATIDVLNIPGLMESLGDPEYEKRLTQRFTLASIAKSNLRTLLLDNEEKYDRKSASFTTLPEILDRFLQMVAGAADIPATRLLGQAPAGMNATGESDLRNFYDRVSAMQKLELQPAMSLLDECLICSALGSRPPEIFYSWAPLWQISEKEKSEIGKAASETASNLVNSNLFTGEELRAVVTNQFVEAGYYPGLDAVISEAEGDVDLGQDDDEADPAPQKRPTRDSAPRTLYVRRDVLNRADIVAWAEAQGFTDIVPDLHVTIAYSTTPVNWFAMGESWSPKMEVAAGGPRQVEGMGPDGKYKAILFTAGELIYRHKAMIEAGATWDWPEYQPHISVQVGGDIDVTKIEPYRGKIELGPEIFEEVRSKA